MKNNKLVDEMKIKISLSAIECSDLILALYDGEDFNKKEYPNIANSIAKLRKKIQEAREEARQKKRVKNEK